LIFGVILPFVALVIVGGLLALLLIRHEIGEVKGLWQTTRSKVPSNGSKNPSEVSDDKPSPHEVKTQYKPYKQSTQEEHPQPSMNEGNQGHPWRW